MVSAQRQLQMRQWRLHGCGLRRSISVQQHPLAAGISQWTQEYFLEVPGLGWAPGCVGSSILHAGCRRLALSHAAPVRLSWACRAIAAVRTDSTLSLICALRESHWLSSRACISDSSIDELVQAVADRATQR